MKWLLVFLSCLAPLLSASKIHTIESITEMEVFLDEENHTLVGFDIDDTLTILRDPAFHRVNFKTKHSVVFEKTMKGLNKKQELVAFTLPLLTTPGDLIEHESPLFIDNLQKKKKFRTFAITAAMGGQIGGMSIEDRRHAELKRVGIDFSVSFAELPEMVFIGSKEPVMGSHPVFKNGIIYSNDTNKGEVLIKFLQALPWKPTHIIFVDDRLDHLLAIEAALQKHYPEIVFIGLHFQTTRIPYKDTDEEYFRAKWIEHIEKAKEILANAPIEVIQ